MAQEILEKIKKAEAASELRLNQARQTADKRIEEEKQQAARLPLRRGTGGGAGGRSGRQKAQEQAQQKKMEILRSYQSDAFSIQQYGQAKCQRL